MEREAAKRLVRQTFEKSFNRDQFHVFVNNLLNKLEPAAFPRPRTGQYIFADFRDYIASFDRIGKYEDKEGNKLDVLIVQLNRQTSLERARAAQRKFVAKYLKASQGGQFKDAALVAFVSPNEEDWRFSFVKMDYKIETTEKGRVKVKEEFTPARRYSFLVGKNENSHTAQSQLLPILENTNQDPTIRSIEERFSIEKVTKEFFEQYRELYHKVKDALDTLVTKDKDIQADFKEKGVDTVDFAKKLLGQIVFLYFLQKKGWFGVKRKAPWGTGSKAFLRELCRKEHGKYRNFFNEILEPLFYNTLAVERPENYSDRFDCRIPFLNGGLFDPLNNYDWVNTDILLSNELFSNDEKTKQGDVGTGVLDVFDRYNFTVKEDEPLEKEVAVDPEMLGKVFENLLEVKDRKSKGTYYTPREIVHYMCQESLINYLATELHGTVPREDIETLIKHGETALENDALVSERGEERGRYKYKLPESVRDNAQVIDEKLADIKVCDPAVGSGAFLVGMMSEIVRTRMVLSEFLDTDTEHTAYDLKRHAIQNSLYGVDIDLGAVEIAKLRLWLSLIVDEDDYRNIKPLPNLDYKIMQGNSLLEEYESIKLIDERFFDKREEKVEIRERLEREQSQIQRDYIRLDADGQLTKVKKAEYDKRLREIEKQLKEIDKPRSNGQDNLGLFGKTEAQSKADKLLELHERFFNAYHKSDKDRIHKQIDELTWDLIKITLKQKGKEDKLEDVKKFKRTNTNPFFLWKLNFAEIFRDKYGFDVVIANPPYITFKGKERVSVEAGEVEAYKRVFPNSAQYKINSFALFLERGLTLLGNGGSLAFIIPSTILQNQYLAKIRQYILSSFTIRAIVTFGARIFEAVTDSVILIVQNGEPTSGQTKVLRKNDLVFTPSDKAHTVDQALWSGPNGINLKVDQGDNALINKIGNQATDLGDICDVRIGIKRASAPVLAGPKPGYKPFLLGRDLEPFRINFADRFILFDKSLFHTPVDESIFLQPVKILVRKTGNVLIASLDTDQYYTDQSVYNISLLDSASIPPQFILAILNSRVMNYVFKKAFITNPDIYPYIKGIHLKKLPIRMAPAALEKQVVETVDALLTLLQPIPVPGSSKADKLAALNKRLDKLVYRVYDLDAQDIEVIEDAIGTNEDNKHD